MGVAALMCKLTKQDPDIIIVYRNQYGQHDVKLDFRIKNEGLKMKNEGVRRKIPMGKEFMNGK
jgi:hypothetical protein